jgi:hypothetical protein
VAPCHGARSEAISHGSIGRWWSLCCVPSHLIVSKYSSFPLQENPLRPFLTLFSLALFCVGLTLLWITLGRIGENSDF